MVLPEFQCEGLTFGSGSVSWNSSDSDTAGVFDDSGDLVSQTSY